MKSLEEVYENHYRDQFSSMRHETKELDDLRRVSKHTGNIKDILSNLPNSSTKQKLLYELKFVESYIVEMINLHSSIQQ